jgi:DUF2075 family protein
LIIYEATKGEFVNHVQNNEISDRILESFKDRIGRTSESEISSWANSMNFMYHVVATEELPDDLTVAIEYRVPSTSKRVDFILTGVNPENRLSAVIVELKQWTKVEKVDGKDGIVRTHLGGQNREVTHPSYQAWTYAHLITQYNEAVRDEQVDLVPCAYLHNYNRVENDPIFHNDYDEYLNDAPVFTKGDTMRLRGFITTYLKKSDQRKALYLIEHGRIRPSKSLQDSIAEMIKGNPEFQMIDDQKVAFETILDKARLAYSTGKKEVLIVEGGPGTGKSVLAIQALANLIGESMVCQYVTKNAAPRSVYATKLQANHKKKIIDHMFKGSGSYTNSVSNELDVLVVDEAHRLNEKSGMFQNLGENQMKEIIHTAKCSVFFIDEDQRVTFSDVGNKEDIYRFAYDMGADVTELKLDSQFRCNGSDGYLAWLDDVLGIRETANFDGFDNEYDLHVFDNPNELRMAIREKNKLANKARIVAGYCWEWKKEGKNNPNINDIELDEWDFQMSWNLFNSSTWAIDPESVEQAGCIHTCQGLEFDYVGVIIGDDLRFEDGKVITDGWKRASTDKSLKGFKSLWKKNPEEARKKADAIIRNTYRTLMTRGMKGCYLYCTDRELNLYFKKLIG